MDKGMRGDNMNMLTIDKQEIDLEAFQPSWMPSKAQCVSANCAVRGHL
jgi:hypothetical protein